MAGDSSDISIVTISMEIFNQTIKIRVANLDIKHEDLCFELV